MEEEVVDSLLNHSKLDVFDTVHNLTISVHTQIQTGYQYEHITSYCHDLNLLKNLITCIRKNDICAPDGYGLVSTCRNIVDKICIPIFGWTNPTRDSRKNVLVLLGSVCRLTGVCIACDDEILIIVLEHIQGSLDSFLKEKPSSSDLNLSEGILDMYSVCEMLRHILQRSCENKDKNGSSTSMLSLLRQVFTKLVQALEIASFDTVGSGFIPALTKLLEIDTENQPVYLDMIWMHVQMFSNMSRESKQYLLLCGFANLFFPIDGQVIGTDIRRQNKLWEILQSGLLSKDSLNRKRCLYLVKRIIDICEKSCNDITTEEQLPIFWWKTSKQKELSKVWEDFMLLAEVFEEKQVHVIKPLLPRMRNLIAAAAIKDQPLLHTSWITTLLMRSNHHESLQIIRWGTEMVLTMDFTTCPFFEQGQDEYLSGALLESLDEPKLFTREAGTPVGSLPVIALRLEQFFTTCWKCLTVHKRGPFFSRVVQNICNRDWGPYSLLFVCRGLSLVPSSPCLDRDTILSIRKLLTGHLVCLEGYLRGAVLCYMVETVIHLTDKKQVPVDDFMQMLAVVERGVCFQRGTTLWSLCVDWLQEEVEENSDWSPVSFTKNIEAAVNKYLETSLDSSYSLGDQSMAHVIARQLLLGCDSTITTENDENQSSCLIRVLQKLTEIINSINSHAYMSKHKADKAIQLMVLIVQEMEPARCKIDDDTSKTIITAVTQCQDELSAFICCQINESVTSLSDIGLLKMYLTAVRMLTDNNKSGPCSSLCSLVKASVNLLNTAGKSANKSLHSKMKELSAMCIMGMLSDFLSHDRFVRSQEVRSDIKDLKESIFSFARSWKINLTLEKPSTEESLNQQEWGKVTSLYLLNQWRIIRLALLSSTTTLWCEPEDLLNQSAESLSVGLHKTSIPIMQSVKLILPHVLSKPKADIEAVVCAMNACLAFLLEVGSSVMFWNVLDVFVDAVFQPCLLMQDEDSLITETVKKISEKFFEMSEKQGVVFTMAKQLFKSFSKPGMCEHAIKYSFLIKELCIHGGILKRGNRQLFDMSAALEDMGETLSVNQIMDVTSNQDILSRAVAVNFLCQLNPSDDTHCCLATNLIQLCIEHYKRMPMNAFSNSFVHLQRHRLIQTVLLLESLITKEYVPVLWSFVWSSLQQELQPSVRHMQEWIAMWMMYRHDHLAQQLWILFDKYQETKNLIVCSLLCIVTHMGPHLPSHRQEWYYEHALSKILPWCMAHHFNTRIFAQATIVKLWQQCCSLQLSGVLKAHSILGCLVDFNQKNTNSTKNVKKLLDSFFFKFLDFKRDFSLETLFYLLPLMTSITEEDWIKPEVFIQTNPDWEAANVSQFVQLRNTTDHLSTCDPGTWKYRSLKNADDIDDIFSDHGDGDVQKKIMPWKQMVPDEETNLEIDYGVKAQREDGLIVVTSLINKVPNLGGLCRTSEIFGVSEYIMGSLKFLEDKAFQSLSVTAHKWLPITEVHESKLADYLQQKRQEGYSLVGAEQTANSVCLTEYKFPQKTLLLLGNEKEGIPVDLISLLDVCVEIPQQGVVRSLNVHVSGALLIWEYLRQQLTNSPGTALS